MFAVKLRVHALVLLSLRMHWSNMQTVIHSGRNKCFKWNGCYHDRCVCVCVLILSALRQQFPFFILTLPLRLLFVLNAREVNVHKSLIDFLRAQWWKPNCIQCHAKYVRLSLSLSLLFLFSSKQFDIISHCSPLHFLCFFALSVCVVFRQNLSLKDRGTLLVF